MADERLRGRHRLAIDIADHAHDIRCGKEPVRAAHDIGSDLGRHAVGGVRLRVHIDEVLHIRGRRDRTQLHAVIWGHICEPSAAHHLGVDGAEHRETCGFARGTEVIVLAAVPDHH